MSSSGNQTAMHECMLEKSILVVAHPDDEVLWFSSILRKVSEIVVCFLDVPSYPEWSEGRRKSIKTYPLANLSCLGITESEVFNGAAWPQPSPSAYGLQIRRTKNSLPGFSDERYRSNFDMLKDLLRDKLVHCSNVITHNPWGEYGHEEHVQVYRALKALQSEIPYRLWFSNYCSNKTHNYMLSYISGFYSDYTTLKTDKDLGASLRELYQSNKCWTWFDDYEWFNEESFMEDRKSSVSENRNHGHIFPLNFIKVEVPWETRRKSESFFNLLRKWKNK